MHVSNKAPMLLGLVTVRQNSCRILPKYGEEIKEEKKELRLRKKHKVKKRKDVATEEVKERRRCRKTKLH